MKYINAQLIDKIAKKKKKKEKEKKWKDQTKIKVMCLEVYLFMINT